MRKVSKSFAHFFGERYWLWRCSPQLLAHEDVPRAEEGDSRKPQVLVQHEHAHGDDVGVTQVVDETADVAIVTGVDAVHLTVLGGSGERGRVTAV